MILLNIKIYLSRFKKEKKKLNVFNERNESVTQKMHTNNNKKKNLFFYKSAYSQLPCFWNRLYMFVVLHHFFVRQRKRFRFKCPINVNSCTELPKH